MSSTSVNTNHEVPHQSTDCKTATPSESVINANDDDTGHAESNTNNGAADEPKLAASIGTKSTKQLPTTSTPSNRPIPTNKKMIQSTNNADKTNVSDIVTNPKVGGALHTNKENSSSQSIPRNHQNYRGANAQSGPRRMNGSIIDSQMNSDGHTSEYLSRTNLYIRGLAPTTTDDDLFSMCTKFGNIMSTKAILDKATGCCRGYGFVQYSAPHSAELAVVELTKMGVQAQMARVTSQYAPKHYSNQHSSNNYSHYQHHQYQHHNSQNNHNPNQHNHGRSNLNVNSQPHNHDTSSHTNSNIADPTNLYLANLPNDMGESALETLLSNYGPVVSTRILRDERNNPRGVGFARMESRDKCQEIIEKLNGKSYKGSREPLLVKFADGGNKKRLHNNNSNQNYNNSNTHRKLNQDDNRWQEGSDSQSITPSMYGHQRNLSHNSQLPDIPVMTQVGYHNMQPTFSAPMAPNAAYQTVPLGPPASTHQWLPAAPGQTWNVIPQHLIQPGLGSSSQTAVPANYPYGHIPQLASQMQGLQITHHSGSPIGGYLPPLWPQVWSHPMQPPPHQAQSQSGRLASGLQAPAAPSQPILQLSKEVAQTFVESQEVPKNLATKQQDPSDMNKKISAPSSR